MHRPLIAIVVALFFALGAGGCLFTSNNKDYDEILMPAQTGSVLQRRVQVKKIESREKPEEPKKKKSSSSKPKPKPEEEPSATPAPQEESTPPTDRFR